MAARAATLASLVGVACHARTALAQGTIWERTRHPETERRRDLIVEAESLERKAHHVMMIARSDTFLGESQLARAAILLHEAGAETSPDLFVRYRLASIYEQQHRPELALPLLESILRADPPAPLRASVYTELGVVYAHLGRIDDEIAAYGKALRDEAIAPHRATLLANRAEAYLLQGDASAAVTGYRAALALLTADDLVFGTGSTTLWGLGVALDRSGDLDSGLDAIRVARIYDRLDRHLEPPNWFYSPAYDKHWYEALGYWQVARKTDAVLSARVDGYARAVASFEEFIGAATTAAPDDKWLPLARVRLKQCEAERGAFLRRQKLPVAPPRREPRESHRGVDKGPLRTAPPKR